MSKLSIISVWKTCNFLRRANSMKMYLIGEDTVPDRDADGRDVIEAAGERHGHGCQVAMTLAACYHNVDLLRDHFVTDRLRGPYRVCVDEKVGGVEVHRTRQAGTIVVAVQLVHCIYKHRPVLVRSQQSADSDLFREGGIAETQQCDTQ